MEVSANKEITELTNDKGRKFRKTSVKIKKQDWTLEICVSLAPVMNF